MPAKIKIALFYLRRVINYYLVILLSKRCYDSIPDCFKDFNAIIHLFSRKVKDFFFIQIGANDGVKGDPLRKHIIRYNWSGILVEPIKYYFEKLVKNYTGQKGLFFENVAISNTTGTSDIYYLKEEILKNGKNPPWSNLLGSLDKKNVLSHKHKIPHIENYLVKETTKLITINELMYKYNVKKVDLLHIDAEGHEYKILSTINFKTIRPRIIFYEHCNLGMDREKCRKLLKDNGYSFIELVNDTLAFIRFRDYGKLCP